MNDREKLIDIVCNAAQINGCIHSCKHPPCAMVGIIVDALIANGVTVQQWIPVSERLPEARRLVLCRWTRGIGAFYGFARYNHDIGVWYVSNEGMPKVTHWMPLPEPLKGE